MSQERNYTALPIVVGILKLVAALIFIFGVLVVVAGASTLSSDRSPFGMIVALAVAVGPVLTALVLYAFAELLDVAMDIEANTRRAADERLISEAMKSPALDEIRLR